MEESWRFRPTQGNICPTCLISHFPFCSRPLPFDRIQNDPTFHRLFPDPHHHRGFPSPHLPLPHENPYGIPRPLAPNFENQFPAMIDLPVADRLQRGGFHPPPRFDYGGTEFMRGESIESDRINKRMRVDDMGFGPSVPPPLGGYNSHPTRMPLEDERRLSLIRSHGAPQLHSTFSTGPGDHPAFEETRGSEWRPRAPASSYYDRTSSMLHQESGFDSAPKIAGNGVYQEKKEPQLEESGFGFEKQNIGGFHSNVESVFQRKMDGSREDSFFPSRNEPMQQPQYSHNNNLGYPHYSYRPSNVPTSALDYVNTSRNDTSSNLVREEDRHFMNKDENRVLNFQKDDLNRQQHILHHVPNLIPYESRGKYTEHQATGFNHAQEFPYHHESNNTLSSSGSAVPNHGNSQNTHFHTHESDTRRSFEVEHPLSRNVEGSTPHLYYQEAKQLSSTKIDQPGVHFPRFNTGNGLVSVGQVQVPALDYSVPPPPLPPLPPPPLPMEPPGPPPTYAQPKFSPPKTSSSMYSIPVASSAATPLLHPPALESQPFPPRNPSPDKPKLIDASCLFKQPNRATRPDHIVIILRGLPGSGKSFLAKMLRDLEVESGADAPRIHSMDDYFMTEVEKVEESESSKSSSLGKGKKRITKKVMEYCYEPEMEEAYRSSMLKAFKKTLDEGMFTFIIVDDRNLRVADFAQFWANAKRSGYEVYLLEANYKDPAGCAARNIHGFTSDDIKRMAEMWEEAPSFYLRLDTQSLFCGDDLKEHGIREVDMDMEDAGGDEGSSGLHDMNSMKKLEPPLDDLTHGFVEDEGRWNVERDEPIGVKELGRSKWSDDVDEEDIERSDGNGKSNALSGLIQAYSKGDKSVHWGDQVGKTGFAISATRKANSLSLVIGPGAGYNLKSNPLPEEETIAATHTGWQSKKKNVFQEQLQAERESFRAVFDRRRHRIGGLQMEEE